MNKKINVLLVDDNQNFLTSAEEYFKDHAVINKLKTINNGKDALEEIVNNHLEYDLLVLDLIMPNIDGIQILEDIKSLNTNLKTIAISSYNSDTIDSILAKYNVDYCLIKPIDFKVLERRIYDVTIKDRDNFLITDLNQYVTKLLHSLGVPSHIKGYTYIRDSIIKMYENPDLIGAITKELYPSIALKYDTTPSRVERAIRHAIEISWNRGDYDLMDEIFGHSVDFDKSKPTNSEFIATIADKLRIEKRKNRVLRYS